MLNEFKNGLNTVANVSCDGKGCSNADSVFAQDRQDARIVLIERGWVLSKDKHYCNACRPKTSACTLFEKELQMDEKAYIRFALIELANDCEGMKRKINHLRERLDELIPLGADAETDIPNGECSCVGSSTFPSIIDPKCPVHRPRRWKALAK